MPCGTGKSLMAYWIARALEAKTVVLAVPSLALVKYSLGDWTAEFLAEGIRPQWLAVCSDDSVGSMKEADSTVSTVYEAGIPTTTDQKEIIKFLGKKQENSKNNIYNLSKWRGIGEHAEPQNILLTCSLRMRRTRQWAQPLRNLQRSYPMKT